MKIIEVISDTNIGGAGVLLINRLSLTDIKKYKTVVLLPKGSALCHRLRKIPVPYIEIDGTGDNSFDISDISKYIKIISKIKPDIINTHGCLSARIAAKICCVPVKICTRHCVFPISKREKLFGRLSNLLTDRFIAVAYSAKQNLVGFGVSPRKISVIINGALPLRRISDTEKENMRKSLIIADGDTVLGFCARLEKCKGHDWFFKALKKLKEDNVHFKAVLLGDGSQRARLEDLCREYGIEESVHFCGFVADISPIMNIVDININCSVGTETSSLALSEGMSLGLPAVVSDYGGNPYMIKHGVNGFVCPVGDFEKMVQYIKCLIDDRVLYKKMSSAAIARFKSELNAKAMTQKTNRLYDIMYCRRVGKFKD